MKPSAPSSQYALDGFESGGSESNAKPLYVSPAYSVTMVIFQSAEQFYREFAYPYSGRALYDWVREVHPGAEITLHQGLHVLQQDSIWIPYDNNVPARPPHLWITIHGIQPVFKPLTHFAAQI